MVEVFRLAQFEYDQLNRITASSTLAGAFANTFKTGYTYDANGNLLTLNRFDKSGIQFDKLGYTYQNEKNGYVRNTNRLTSVSDISSDRLDDIEGQSADNYAYDEIGNLSRDESEKIKTIEWNTYGKVKRVERYPLSGKADLYFEYDASGNRVLKTVVTPSQTTSTYYLRDATGNVMATYEGTPSTTPVSLQEQYLYGSSRVGMLSSTGRSYELTDHLGNVRTVVGADNKVLSASDYYPFGMVAKELNGAYRYGFNGKEKDDEGMGGGLSTYDYGFRIYNPALGKFLSVDPLAKKYPMLSAYQFAANMPIKYIDLDGLEPANNPDDPANQDNRNPTETVNKIFEISGGDENYQSTLKQYLKGSYDAESSIDGVSNKDGYTSDSKNDADNYNLWVNNKGVFYADDYENFDSKDFSNFLLGNMINGTGPENMVFPTDGTVSKMMKESGIVKDAVNSWYELNKGLDYLVSDESEFSGNKYMPGALVQKGAFHPESFIGSASITISPINDKEVMVIIFNVTSISSGDLQKMIPGNSTVKSVVRDPNQTSSSGANSYGNMSQTYSFTMPIDYTR